VTQRVSVDDGQLLQYVCAQ